MAARGDGALGLALASGQLVATIFPPDEPLRRRTIDVPLGDGSPAGVIATIRDAVSRLLDMARKSGLVRFTSLGASLGGHIDHANGVVVYAHDLIVDGHSWRDEKLASMLSDAFGVPAVIENDVNCMVEFQRRAGLGRDQDSFVVIYLAADVKGLGSGILINDQIVRGAAGGAGEFGHVVVQPGGPRCHCGNRGCLQAVLNTETLVRNVNWGQREAVVDLAGAAGLAERGDPRASEAFQQAGRSFGQALSMIVNMLNPRLVLLGGPEELVGPVPHKSTLMRRRERPLPRVRRRKMRSTTLFTEGYESTLTAYSFCELERYSEVAICELTLEIAAIGAAMLAHSEREPKAVSGGR